MSDNEMDYDKIVDRLLFPAGGVSQTRAMHAAEAIRQLRARVAELEVENERLRLDAARIDWLGDRDNHIGNVQLPTRCVEENISSFRGAIDMAMGLNREFES